jgi:hypothetical protein
MQIHYAETSEREVSMAVKRPVVDSGTVLAKVIPGKKSLKHSGKQIAPSHPVTAPEVALGPAEVGIQTLQSSGLPE